MKKKNTSANNSQQLVSFRLADAQRIASAVSVVESTRRTGRRSTLPRASGGGGGEEEPAFRVCTFSGAWSKGSSKSVTFRYSTATPNIVSAANLFANIGTATASRTCAIAREGTAWFLIAAEC